MTVAQTFSKYQILGELGRGGFGVVYQANDMTLDREVALKIFSPQLLNDQLLVQRFQREARTLASLRHSHIITIYEFGEADGRMFIAMELAHGASLARLIGARGRLLWDETLELLKPICEALDYAHGHDIVHRDLKPANILLDTRGPMLSDFGFARLLGENSASMSVSGGIVGTPGYIAPEVWDNNAAGASVDIYALGCIGYEMLTGAVLFKGQTPIQAMRAHDRGPQFPSIWPDDIPSGINDALRKALAKEPGARYDSAIQFWRALDDLRSPVAQAALTTSISEQDVPQPSASTPARGAAQAPSASSPVERSSPAPRPWKAGDEEETASPPRRSSPVPWMSIVGAALAIVFVTILLASARGPTPAAPPAPTRSASDRAATAVLPLPTAPVEEPTSIQTTPTSLAVDSSIRWAEVITQSTELRQEPNGAKVQCVSSLHKGDRLVVKGRDTSAGWLLVDTTEGRSGWVAVLDVQLDGAADPEAVAVAPSPVPSPEPTVTSVPEVAKVAPSSTSLSLSAPKLNQMEEELNSMRQKLASGKDLTQAEMLKYQDLMQRMNQIFMWAQGSMQSEHEKNKGWAQRLGCI